MTNSDHLASEEFATSNQPGFALSPRIALGMQGECWGLIGRYWRLQTGGLDPNPATLAGDGAVAANYFHAETVDLEVTRLLASGPRDAQLRLSFGVRYAQLNEAAGLTLDETNDLGSFRSEVFSSHNFSGAGITMGLVGIRPVGCNGFHLFVDGRCSILWDGHENNYVSTLAEYFGDNTASHAANSAYAESTGNLFIGEIQIGGQWDLPLKCIPANAFVRLAFEYQYWCTGCSSGAEATSFAGPDPLVVASGKSIGDSHVDLVGFTIGTGLTW